jgi:hypothetical protein
MCEKEAMIEGFCPLHYWDYNKLFQKYMPIIIIQMEMMFNHPKYDREISNLILMKLKGDFEVKK